MSVGEKQPLVPQPLWDALDGAHWQLVAAVQREGREKAVAGHGDAFNRATAALTAAGATTARTVERLKGLDGERGSAVYSLTGGSLRVPVAASGHGLATDSLTLPS